jgi:prepilin peptidase CpaA
MNNGLPNSMPELLQLALAALVVTAAVTDLVSRRIPNWLASAGLAAGLGMNVYLDGWSGFSHSMLGMLLGAGLFIGFHLTGGMGAGDVKLFAAVGAIVGPQSLLVIFVLTGIFGGIAALALLVVRGRLGDGLRRTLGLTAQMARSNWVEVKRRSDRRAAGALALPYGAVVATGSLVFLFAIRNVVR